MCDEITHSRFTISCPDCTLHTAITHMTKILELVESHESFDGETMCETLLLQIFPYLSDGSAQCAIGTKIVK